MKRQRVEHTMRKILTTMSAAAIAAAVIVSPMKAEARCWGCGGWGWGVGGLAVGLVGGAILASGAYGYPGYGGYGYGNFYGAYGGYGYAPLYVDYGPPSPVFANGYGYDYGYAPGTYGYAPAYYGGTGYYAARRLINYDGYAGYRGGYRGYGGGYASVAGPRRATVVRAYARHVR
jgi:hypothetical protein